MSESIHPTVDVLSVVHSTRALITKQPPASREKATPSEEKPLVFDSQALREDLRKAIEQLNEQVKKNGRGLFFSVDERLNRQVITVRSTATGEVVRQIPNEVILKVAHSIEDVKGLLLDGML